METQRFKKGEKVYWNAGWNENLKYDFSGYTSEKKNEKAVGWMIRGPYDFGYYSVSQGKVILYKEGESSMQDSFCVPECYVISEKEFKQTIGL